MVKEKEDFEVQLDKRVEKFMGHMLSEIDKTKEYKNLAFVGNERPYLFSNERLDVTIRRLKPQNKKVLTTGSSGDQVMYLIANGAKKITLFDLCPYSLDVLNYKIALIKTLEYKDAHNVIFEGSMFSYKTYQKISHCITGESKDFWDYVFMEGFDGRYIDICKRKDSREDKAEYLKNEVVYNELKDALVNGKYKLKFINCHMKDLGEKIAKESDYDIIILSNIIKYASKWDESKFDYRKHEYWEAVKRLSQKLKKGGAIQIDYAYNNLLERYMYYSLLFGSERIKSSGINRHEGAIYYIPEKEM